MLISSSEELAVSCGELYFVHGCALKRTGKYASESKVMCLFYRTDFKSDVFMFHS